MDGGVQKYQQHRNYDFIYVYKNHNFGVVDIFGHTILCPTLLLDNLKKIQDMVY